MSIALLLSRDSPLFGGSYDSSGSHYFECHEQPGPRIVDRGLLCKHKNLIRKVLDSLFDLGTGEGIQR